MISEPQWLARARDFVGLREIAGPMHEPKILQLWRDAHMDYVHDDETAWCAAFVGAMLERSLLNSSRKPNARSYQHWGIDVKELSLGEIPLGAIIVFDRPPNPEHGHVGFAVGLTPHGDVVTLGGNQSDSVSIAPKPANRLIAARWPAEERTNLGLLRPLPIISTTAPVSVKES